MKDTHREEQCSKKGPKKVEVKGFLQRKNGFTQKFLMAYFVFVCLFVCFSFWFLVLRDEEYGRQREINRTNSDSVLYIKPKGNEAAAVLSSLKTAETKFQLEKIETLESKIDRISKAYEEQEERDLEIQQRRHVADQPDDGMK